MKYRAVIFDMDGVIFDSERLLSEEWLAFAKKHGLAGMEEVYSRCIGVNATSTRKIFLDYYGQDFPYDTYVKEIAASFHERYDHGRLPMKPGVTELLSCLKEAGYLIGLASSTKRSAVEQEITDARLMKYFDDLTCGDMLQKSKPEPDIFLMACSHLGVSSDEAVAIEDSYNGIRAAYRAGMVPVMVPDMMQPDDEMKQLAHIICRDLLEVRKWFDRELL